MGFTLWCLGDCNVWSGSGRWEARTRGQIGVAFSLLFFLCSVDIWGAYQDETLACSSSPLHESRSPALALRTLQNISQYILPHPGSTSTPSQSRLNPSLPYGIPYSATTPTCTPPPMIFPSQPTPTPTDHVLVAPV
ncbi:hypothetical protein JAAARDRAFT_38287 [Jaapia argillacea MUCL 33604]|uniref:Uncharacterized protein n=1 Tax=Jaapia argillacea MUCL 33604 TaxID=933084 RepID=A0A067PIJ1_9AGAM|nr:hypothetical protein JAAARDRAFT_38287 [Jaapia argillacea MUCL 33604]